MSASGWFLDFGCTEQSVAGPVGLKQMAKAARLQERMVLQAHHGAVLCQIFWGKQDLITGGQDGGIKHFQHHV